VTPGAVTPAARTGRRGTARPGAHPRPVRAPATPRAPRRVSGPLRAQPERGHAASSLARAAEFVRGLPDHPLLDRLVRGRAWIPVLGVMLAGIVAMQVEVLKLNASMGRSIALAASLQARNDTLQTSVSLLSDPNRIERLAARMGMVLPGPTAVDFLRGRASPGRAVAGIHAPDAAEFDAALQASIALAAATTSPSSSALTSPQGTTGAATTATGTTGAATTASSTIPAASPPATSATTAASSGRGTATGTGATSQGPASTGSPATTATSGATTSSTNTGGAAPAG
jgi:hypothetical protein